MITCTQAQLDALYKIYQRWQKSTPHAIMPQEFNILSKEDFLAQCGICNYIGLWVGGPAPEGLKKSGKKPTGMYLGIEVDGHTHS